MNPGAALALDTQRVALEVELAQQLGLQPLPEEMRVLLEARKCSNNFCKEGLAIGGVLALGNASMSGPSQKATHRLVGACLHCFFYARNGDTLPAPLKQEQFSAGCGESIDSDRTLGNIYWSYGNHMKGDNHKQAVKWWEQRAREGMQEFIEMEAFDDMLAQSQQIDPSGSRSMLPGLGSSQARASTPKRRPEVEDYETLVDEQPRKRRKQPVRSGGGGSTSSEPVPMPAPVPTPAPARAPAPDDEDSWCVICQDNPKTHLLVPCGHFHYCGTCVEKFKKQPRQPRPELKECSICRAAVVAPFAIRVHR